jgi:hypothetical protein
MARQTYSDSESSARPMIEEHVDTGLKELLAGYRSNFTTGSGQNDMLTERYSILVNQPIAELNHDLARAYQAQDSQQAERACYALVLENHMPYRLKMADTLSAINNQHLQMVLGAGTVRLSHLGEARHVVFLEKPPIQRLSEFKKLLPVIHEHTVIDRILTPISTVLRVLKEKELVHGNINMETVYFNDAVVVGECLSSPCSYFQNFMYEPLERLMADQLCKGVGDAKTDVYASGVLAFQLIYGTEHLKGISRDDFIRAALNVGTYHLLANNRELSDNMADFFRGVLNDNRNERWDIDQFSAWLGGKRYNMIVPPAPKEAVRPLEFVGQQFYNRRALGNAFHKNWRTTLKELRAMRLDRWFEMSMHRPELADRVERVMRIGGEASADKTNDDMLCRLICILDPVGPIRTAQLSMRPEGMGIILADCMYRGQPPETQQLLDAIEMDIPNYWAYLTEDAKPGYLSHMLWKLQRVRPYIKMRAMGFGLERVLYELNPNMTCLSPLVRAHHVMNLQEMLKTLDTIAYQCGPDTSFLDRHLIAFTACKLDMGKEAKLHDLASIPSLASNQELIALRILARAQQKYEKLALVGLATWAAMRIEKMLDQMHNRTMRKKLKLKLKGAAATGYLWGVLNVIINRDVANKDFEGFGRALLLHQRNQKNIDQLRNPTIIGRYAQDLGGRVAMMIAYVILLVSSYFMTAKIMHW